ncbi:MAG: 50S ribosomal protein L21 [Actinomycetota bacterium]
MYAVIRAGGKQFKVSKGDVIDVERFDARADTVDFTPLLVVEDDGTARAGRSELDGAAVSAKVRGEVKGTKVHVYKYRSKTGYRRHTGHRQKYTSIEISDITLGGSRARGGATNQGGDGDGA